jgi:antitoxin YefM
MISGIREKTVVGEGGKIEISSPELAAGTEIEVIVIVLEEERDATEYLLSAEANRQHLEQAVRDAENPEKLIYLDIENL